MNDIDLSIYSLIHDSDIQPKEIAAKTGISYQVLLNKSNPSCDTHKLTCSEALAIMLITGNRCVLHALKEILDNKNKKKSDLTNSLVSISKEVGDVVRAVVETGKHGRITTLKKRNCIKEIDEAITELELLKTHFNKNKQ